VPGVDAPAARRHPRRTNLAGQLEERAHAPRLPARRAALQHLMRTLSITMPAERLHQADHKGVVARERFMRRPSARRPRPFAGASRGCRRSKST
jgi:hypothetical protein